MADNTQLNAGAGGDLIASDDVGGIKFQRVKVVWGSENIASDTEVSNPLPVSLTHGLSVNVGNQPTVLASLTNISVNANVTNTVSASLTGVPNVNVVNQPTVLASLTNTWAVTVNNPSTNPVLTSLTYAMQSVAVANTVVASLSNISVAVNNPSTNPVLASLTFGLQSVAVANTVSNPIPASLTGTPVVSLTAINFTINNPSTNPILSSLTYAVQSVAISGTPTVLASPTVVLSIFSQDRQLGPWNVSVVTQSSVSTQPIGPVTLGNSANKINRFITGTVNSTGTTVQIASYTVSAGKTFYWQGFDGYGYLQATSTTMVKLGDWSVESPAGTKIFTYTDFNPTTGDVDVNAHDFAEPIPVTAGSVLRTTVVPGVTATITWRTNFWGYEV